MASAGNECVGCGASVNDSQSFRGWWDEEKACFTSFCEPCHVNFREGRFCCWCLSPYEEDEDDISKENPWVGCDTCEKWVHYNCLISNSDTQNLAKFCCPECIAAAEEAMERAVQDVSQNNEEDEDVQDKVKISKEDYMMLERGFDEIETRDCDEVLIHLLQPVRESLMQDCELVVRDGKIVAFPRSPNMEQVLEDWITSRTSSTKSQTKRNRPNKFEYQHFVEQLLMCINENPQLFFYDEEIPVLHLLQVQLRTTENSRRKSNISKLVGVEHLLRLIARLSFIFAESAMDEDMMQKSVGLAQDLQRYLVHHSSQLKYFNAEYMDRSLILGSETQHRSSKTRKRQSF